MGTNHPPTSLVMPHRKVGREMLPTYANSWSPRSLAARTPPVKLRSWSTEVAAAAAAAEPEAAAAASRHCLVRRLATSSSSTGLLWGKPGPPRLSYAASAARVQRRALQLTRAALTTSQASRATFRASGTTSTLSPRPSPAFRASGSTTRVRRVWRGATPPCRAPGLSCLLPSAPAPTGSTATQPFYPFRASSPPVGIASPTSLRRCRLRRRGPHLRPALPRRRRRRPVPRRRRRRRQRTSPSTPAFAPPIPTPSNAFARPTFRRLTASARRAPSRRRRSPSEIA